MSKSKRQAPAKKSHQETSTSAAVESRVLDEYLNRYGLYLFLSLALLIGAVVFRDFLLCNAVYLYKDAGSDSLNAFYPQIVHLFDYLAQTGIPAWSFNQGMGQNIYPFSWNDPFFLVLFLFGRSRLAYGIIYMEMVKILLAGTLFYLYLRRLWGSAYAAIVGALLFSFSGYIVLGSCWTIFSTEAVYAALLLYAFEQFLTTGSWILIPLPIALIALQQPFYLYPYALFLLLYGSLRFVDEKGWSGRQWLVFLATLTGCGALGVASSGVQLFSDILQLWQSPRVGGGASYFKTLLATPMFGFGNTLHNSTALLRFFSSDMLGTGDSYRGWNNYLEAPMYYCGLAPLLLAPQAFIHLRPRQKQLYGALVAVFCVPMIFPYFRYAFWAFSGDYYRTFSFFVAIVLLFLGARTLSALDHGASGNSRYLFGSLAVVLLLLVCGSYAGGIAVDKNLSVLAAVLLCAYAALLHLMGSRTHRSVAKVVFLGLVCCELAFFSSITVNRRVVTGTELRERVGYNDYSNEAIAYLRAADTGFYRVEKNYSSSPATHTSLNDGKVQGYYGTTSYSQFNQQFYIRFLREMEVIDAAEEGTTRWAAGLRSHPALLAVGGVKYYLAKGTKDAYLNNGIAYRLLTTVGDVRVLENKNALPFGFTYDKYILPSDFLNQDGPDKDITLMSAFVADGIDARDLAGLERITAGVGSNAFTFDRFAEMAQDRRKEALSVSEHGQNRIKGRIALAGRKLLFFSIPYDAGWTAKVDGRDADLWRVNIGFMGLPLEAGEHDVELSFTPPWRAIGAYVSLAGLTLWVACWARQTRRR